MLTLGERGAVAGRSSPVFGGSVDKPAAVKGLDAGGGVAGSVTGAGGAGSGAGGVGGAGSGAGGASCGAGSGAGVAGCGAGSGAGTSGMDSGIGAVLLFFFFPNIPRKKPKDSAPSSLILGVAVASSNPIRVILWDA